MNYDQYIAQLSSGTVLGMFDQTWDFGNATAALKDAKMDKNTYVALGLVYDPEYVDGKEIEEHYVNGSLPNVRRGFGISVNCECPERIVAMWEEMLSDEWQLIFNWGIEGEDYYVENGRLLMTEEQYAQRNDNTWKLKNRALAFFESSPKKQGWILEGEYAGNAWDPANQPEIVLGLMNDYDKEFLKHYGYSKFADFVNPPIELAPYGEAWQIDYTPVDVEHQDFLNIQDKRLPELIMCDPAEFDAKWDAFVEEITPSATAFGNYMQQAVLAEGAKVARTSNPHHIARGREPSLSPWFFTERGWEGHDQYDAVGKAEAESPHGKRRAFSARWGPVAADADVGAHAAVCAAVQLRAHVGLDHCVPGLQAQERACWGQHTVGGLGRTSSGCSAARTSSTASATRWP